MTTVIVDYGSGNIFSLSNAVSSFTPDYKVSSDPSDIVAAARIILPGVGAFGHAMSRLEAGGFVEPIKDFATRLEKPVLGICVGMQVLFTNSEEFGQYKGLDLISGTIRRLPEGTNNTRERIPNVGWRTITKKGGTTPEFDIDNKAFYHVHSYYPDTQHGEDTAATIEFNGESIPVMVARKNIVGAQFHPEKSARDGVAFLKAFCSLA